MRINDNYILTKSLLFVAEGFWGIGHGLGLSLFFNFRKLGVRYFFDDFGATKKNPTPNMEHVPNGQDSCRL